MRLSFRERFLITKGRFDWKLIILFVSIVIGITIFSYNIHIVIVSIFCVIGFVFYAFLSRMYPQETAYKKDDIKPTVSEIKMLKIKKRKYIIDEITKGS